MKFIVIRVKLTNIYDESFSARIISAANNDTFKSKKSVVVCSVTISIFINDQLIVQQSLLCLDLHN